MRSLTRPTYLSSVKQRLSANPLNSAEHLNESATDGLINVCVIRPHHLIQPPPCEARAQHHTGGGEAD